MPADSPDRISGGLAYYAFWQGDPIRDFHCDFSEPRSAITTASCSLFRDGIAVRQSFRW
jgi:hypothetical protein